MHCPKMCVPKIQANYKINIDMKNKKIGKSIFMIAFLLPSCLCFLIFYAYPIAQIIITSFCKWDYTNLANPILYGKEEYLSGLFFISWKDVRCSISSREYEKMINEGMIQKLDFSNISNYRYIKIYIDVRWCCSR